MPASIASFFQRYLAQRADETDEHIKTRRARLAAAALLYEVVHADGEITKDERAALLSGVQSQFALTSDEASSLVASAEAQAKQAVDLHRFTTLINQHFSAPQKRELIVELWRAALVDAVLHKHEEYLVRKIADLIYVPHMTMLAAKHQVEQEARR